MKKKLLCGPRFMGGLTRGRVRSVLEKKGIPKKKRGIPKKEKPALRVIQAQGQFDSNGLVKNWCKWIRKMKISHDA